jgi:hypothetical protein
MYQNSFSVKERAEGKKRWSKDRTDVVLMIRDSARKDSASPVS